MSKPMTIRITFTNRDGTRDKILFGNSYKHWRVQAEEYIYRTYGSREHGWRFSDIEDVVKTMRIEQSDSPWVSWGGLKWCEESIFQEKELNREGVQLEEPDNSNPRQYEKFVFWRYPYGIKSLVRELRGW